MINKVGLMRKFVNLILCGLFIVGCTESYVSNKREGMKPYPQEEDSRQAEEAKE